MDWTTWRRGASSGRRAVLLDPFDGLDETGGGGDERHHGGEFIAAEGGVLLRLVQCATHLRAQDAAEVEGGAVMGLHRDGRLGLVEEELALPRAARRKVEVTARLHTEARGGVLGEVLAQLGPAARVKDCSRSWSADTSLDREEVARVVASRARGRDEGDARIAREDEA